MTNDKDEHDLSQGGKINLRLLSVVKELGWTLISYAPQAENGKLWLRLRWGFFGQSVNLYNHANGREAWRFYKGTEDDLLLLEELCHEVGGNMHVIDTKTKKDNKMTNLEVLLSYMDQTCGEGWKLSKDGETIEQKRRGVGTIFLDIKDWLESEDRWDLNSVTVKISRLADRDTVEEMYSTQRYVEEMVNGFCLEEERARQEAKKAKTKTTKARTK